MLSFYPIFRANFNYIDDIGRVYRGYDGWDNFSRYGSDFLSHFVHAGKFLCDIAPLTQIIAIILLSLSALILAQLFNNSSKHSIWEVTALLPIAICPYFLECISFKYDSPYMAFSILASVIPFSLLIELSPMDIKFLNPSKLSFVRATYFGSILYSVVIIVSMLIVCMTYQASLGIFPMIIVCISYKMWCEQKKIYEIFKFILISAVSYIIGVGIFSIGMMKSVDTYVSSSIGSASVIACNYKTYVKLVLSDFKTLWLVIILLMTAIYFASSILYSRRSRLVTLILGMMAVISMLLLSFGIYPFLEKTSTACRAMYGFGVYISVISIATVSKCKLKWIPGLLLLVLCWCFITFSCTFGNSLNIQKEYEDFRIAEVIEDLADLDEFNADTEKKYQFVGSVGHSPVINNMVKEYKILNRLVPIMFRENFYFGQYKFAYYYGLKNILWDREEIDYDEWDVLHESSFHKIYYDNDYFVIELK